MSERKPYEPYSVSRGRTEFDGVILTHCEWHPNNWYGDIAQYETGIRRGDGFELIQHGWPDFAAAEDVIIKAVRKGWSANRISRLMDWLRDRKHKSNIRVVLL